MTPRRLGTMNRSPITSEGIQRRSVAGGFGGTPPCFCRPGVRRAPPIASIATYTTVLSDLRCTTMFLHTRGGRSTSVMATSKQMFEDAVIPLLSVPQTHPVCVLLDYRKKQTSEKNGARTKNWRGKPNPQKAPAGPTPAQGQAGPPYEHQHRTSTKGAAKAPTRKSHTHTHTHTLEGPRRL